MVAVREVAVTLTVLTKTEMTDAEVAIEVFDLIAQTEDTPLVIYRIELMGEDDGGR